MNLTELKNKISASISIANKLANSTDVKKAKSLANNFSREVVAIEVTHPLPDYLRNFHSKLRATSTRLYSLTNKLKEPKKQINLSEFIPTKSIVKGKTNKKTSSANSTDSSNNKVYFILIKRVCNTYIAFAKQALTRLR